MNFKILKNPSEKVSYYIFFQKLKIRNQKERNATTPVTVPVLKRPGGATAATATTYINLDPPSVRLDTESADLELAATTNSNNNSSPF